MGNSFAIENDYEMKYNTLPEKIHENDIVLLEVYNTVSGQVLLEKIQDLKVESLDSSIIEIIDFEGTHDYKTIVKLKAKSEGETILYVFSENSKSLEIPITINGNNLPRGIILDIFPDTLNIDENNQGVLSILLTNENGISTRADKDYLIKLSTSKSEIVSFEDSTVIISKGEFGVKQSISGIKEGIVTITVKTDELESSEILIVEGKSKREIEVSIIPEDISSSNTSSGHIIVQLLSGGKLVKATDDITVYFEVSSSNSTAVNTSLEDNAINPTGYFQIKKGQTYGHKLFSIQKGETDDYTMTVTSQDPLTILDETFQTIDIELYGDGQVKFEALSVLADGNRQLVGIVYLEDTNGHPVTADKDIVIPFITSDELISIENAVIKKGFESALVYGNMGYFVPTDTDIAPNIQNSEVVELDIHGFGKDAVSLKTHVPTDHFLKGEQYWIIVYMESSDGLFKIPENQQFEISESEIFSIDKNKIEVFPYYVLIPITAIDSGDEDLIINSDDFETTISLSSISSKPDSLNLSYSDKLFNGIKDSFVIQILNSKGLPVEINEDIEVKIFSSNPLVIDFPKNVIVPQKSSFTILEIIPITSGITEISLVSEGLPIVTEEITVQETTPTIQITSNDIINEGESFIVSILAKQNGVPLQNADVTWEFEGGISTIAEERTGPTGEAVASIIATSDKSVKILASINNGPFQSAFASKIVRVNTTTLEIFDESESGNSFKKPDMGGFDPVLILVPALIGGMILYMKKKKSK